VLLTRPVAIHRAGHPVAYQECIHPQEVFDDDEDIKDERDGGYASKKEANSVGIWHRCTSSHTRLAAHFQSSPTVRFHVSWEDRRDGDGDGHIRHLFLVTRTQQSKSQRPKRVP
jgi:hypothetical protein